MYQKLLMNLRLLRMMETRMMPKESNERGVSYMHLFWLYRASENAPIPISDLSEAFNVSAAAATQFIKALEKAGFVDRIKNPNDQRSSLVALSSLGIRTVLDAQTEMESRWEELSKYLGQEDIHHFTRIIENIVGYCKMKEGCKDEETQD